MKTVSSCDVLVPAAGQVTSLVTACVLHLTTCVMPVVGVLYGVYQLRDILERNHGKVTLTIPEHSIKLNQKSLFAASDEHVCSLNQLEDG